MDISTIANLFARPGIDPRTWVSYGTVDAGTDDAPSVIFKDDAGNPSPYGPMVNVTLQPSGVSLPCRVSSLVAGEFEAEWYPFVGGDEVIVILPEGSESGGAVIVGRLNQEIDSWPLVVAGQDATKNTFGFKRIRTPFIVETAASYLIRSATTGAQIGIDQEGKVIINDGDKGSITIGPESIGLTSGDQSTFATVFPGTKEVMLGADTASFLLSTDESKFISQGAVSFATSGGAANGHAVTAEQVVALMINVLMAMSGTAPPPLTAAIQTIMVTALTALASGTVPTDNAVPGGIFVNFPLVFGPTGIIGVGLSSPLPQADITGFIPGYGRGGFSL